MPDDKTTLEAGGNGAIAYAQAICVYISRCEIWAVFHSSIFSIFQGKTRVEPTESNIVTTTSDHTEDMDEIPQESIELAV